LNDVFTSECLEKAWLSEYLTRHYTSLISFRKPPRHLIIPSFAISQETATEAKLARNGKQEAERGEATWKVIIGGREGVFSKRLPARKSLSEKETG